MFGTKEEKAAQEFIEKIRRVMAGIDDIIYEFDGRVETRNVISPSTIHHRDAWITVNLYNVRDPEELFDRHMWMKFGEMNVDVETHNHNGESAEILFTKRFT